MADQHHPHPTYGGMDGYRAVHQALSRALAEPAAQGDHAHGARAGFLLKQIAPQIHALQAESITQHLLDAGVPTELLSQLTPYLTVVAKQPPAVNVLVGVV